MKDYYTTLGVSRTATPEEIKKAYRKLALDCHPDRHPNDHTAAQRFLQVDEAYQTLIDSNKRRRYDSFGNAPFGSRNSDVSGFDFSDIFRGRSENNERHTRTRTPETPQEPYFYNGLLWEPQAYRKQSENKELLYFDQSLERLRAAGFERHPRPAEAMQFLAAGLEGKLNDAGKTIYDDMLASLGEWMSAAFEVVPNISNISRPGAQYLRVYPDPSLHLNGSRYEWNGTPTTPQEFDVTDVIRKNLKEWIPLCEFEDAIVQHLYARSFADLPQQMREGDRCSYLLLPRFDENIWPVGRGFGSSFGFYGRYNVSSASRGVRSKASVPFGTQVGAQKIHGNEGKEK